MEKIYQTNFIHCFKKILCPNLHIKDHLNQKMLTEFVQSGGMSLTSDKKSNYCIQSNLHKRIYIYTVYFNYLNLGGL